MIQIPNIAQLIGSVQITGVSQAKSDLQGLQVAAEETGTGFANAGKGVGAMIGAFAGLAIVRQVVGTLSDWTKGAMQAQLASAKTYQTLSSGNHIIGLTASAVDALTQKLSDQAGMDDDVVHSIVNVLAGYKQISSQALPAVTQQVIGLIRANQLAGNGMVDQAQVAKALGDSYTQPTRALRELMSLGVRFTLDQQKQIQAWDKAGETAKAQNLIMQQVQATTKGAIDYYNNTATGATERFQVAVDNLGKGIMTGILPAITALANAGTGFVQWIQQGSAPARAFAIVLGTVAVGALVAFTAAAWSAVAPTLALTWPIIAVAAGVGALAAILVTAYNHWQPFHDIVNKVAGVIAYLVPLVQASLNAAFRDLGTVAGWIGQNVMPPVWQGLQFLGGIIGWLVQGYIRVLQVEFTVAGTILGWIVANVVPPVVRSFQAVGTVIGWLASNVVGPVFRYFATEFSNMVKGVQYMAARTGDAFSALGSLVQNVWSGIASFILAQVNHVIDGINLFIQGANNIPGVSIGTLSHVGGGAAPGGISTQATRGGGGGGGGGFNLGALFSGIGNAPSFDVGNALGGLFSSGSGDNTNGPGGILGALGASGIGGGGGGGGGRGGHGAKGKGAHHGGKGGSSAASSIPADLTSVSQSGVTAAVAAIHAHRGLHGAALDRAILPAVQAAAEAAGAKVGIDRAVADAIAAKDASVLALAAGNRGQLTKAEMKQAVKEGAQAGVSAASKDIAQAVKQGTTQSAKTASITLSNDQIDLASQIAAMIAWENTVR